MGARLWIGKIGSLLLLILFSMHPYFAAFTSYELLMDAKNTVAEPPVILQSGTAGSNTIYTNNTRGSVTVTAFATTFSPDGYNIIYGTHFSGSTPTSVLTIDSEYFVVNSSGIDTSNAYYPVDNDLIGGTGYVSGSLSNLTNDDSVYMTFQSYQSQVTNTEDAVDNDSTDVDSSVDKGSHSNFTAQKTGPDTILDTLTEENAASGSEWLDCNTFDSTYAEWTTVGSTQYLDAQDQPTNYVYEPKTDGDRIGWFEFPDTSLTGTLNVNISIYCNNDDGSSNDWADVIVDYTGSGSGSDVGDIAQHTSWSYDIIDLGSHTVSEVNNLRVYFIYQKSGGADEVRIDHVRVGVSQAVNYELDLEVQWTNVDYDGTSEVLALYIEKGNNTHSLDAEGGYMVVGDGTPDWGSPTGTISFWIKWDALSVGAVQPRPWGQHSDMEARMVSYAQNATHTFNRMFLNWGGIASLTSNTIFTTGKWYFIAIVWNENTDDLYLYVGDRKSAPTEDTHVSGWTNSVSTVGVIENNFLSSSGGAAPTDGHGEDLRYWNINRTISQIQNDYKIELTGSETNLKSYFTLNNDFFDIGSDNNDGSGTGSYSFSSDVPFDPPPDENIRVDVWYSSAWQNVFTDLSIGWNNVSVTPYLVSSTFTIRFKGDTETSDAIQNMWKIDISMIRTTTVEYTSEVEFQGESNLYDWTQLSWALDTSWTVDSVQVTLRLYNYNTMTYPGSGDGYISYTSGTADSDQTKNEVITSNPDYFRNGTGWWRIKVEGLKQTGTQFNLKADLVKVNTTYYGEYKASTEFLFDDITDNQSPSLNFTTVCHNSLEGANVTIQIWNYTASIYPSSGQGFVSYTSTGANVTKHLNITNNAVSCLNGSEAKIKITAVYSSPSSFQQKVNYVKLSQVSKQASYDYVLNIQNQVEDAWKVRLKADSQTNIERLINCTISFKNESQQIVILGGSYNQDTGSWTDLTGSGSMQIVIYVSAENVETSIISIYLEVLKPATTNYFRLPIFLNIH